MAKPTGLSDRGLFLLRELESRGVAILPLDPRRNGY